MGETLKMIAAIVVAALGFMGVFGIGLHLYTLMVTDYVIPIARGAWLGFLTAGFFFSTVIVWMVIRGVAKY